MTRFPTVACGAAAMLVVMALGTLGAALAQGGRWQSYQHPRLGFALKFPGDVFTSAAEDPAADAHQFISRDGQARLIVGAFNNDGGLAPKAYRDFILAENYKGAVLDYAPLRRRWFVISGEIGDRTFYQRVTFVCSGRLINSWAMIYPTAEKQLYDRIVEGVHRSFSPGRGVDGGCEIPAAERSD